MRRYSLFLALALFAVGGCQGGSEQETSARPATESAVPASAQTSDQAKIAQAMSAGPEVIARNATIMDWPATAGGPPRVLRQGSNSWVCYPNSPQTAGSSGDDPMCLDEAWQKFGEAYSARTPPQIQRVGIGYMLQGDKGGSNLDPFATGPTPDNQWVQAGPHLMVIVPDVADLEGIPTDPNNGGPWVMFKGTPYAHIMVPVNP